MKLANLRSVTKLLLARMQFAGLALLLVGACSSDPESTIVSETAGSADGIGSDGIGATSLDGSSLSATDIAGSSGPGSQQDFELNVGDRVFFELDSASLNTEAQQVLDSQSSWLLTYPNVTVTIEGHTDERGTNDYNLALGDRRAIAVKDYVVALGVQPSRILTISYGEERPVDPAHDDVAWALNRRAVTVVNVVN